MLPDERSIAVLLAAVLLAASPAAAAEPAGGAAAAGPVQRTDAASPAFPAPVIGVDELIAGTSVAFLSAAITTKSSGTEFRVSSVPLAAFDAGYVPVVSEAALVVSTDTSSSLTRLAASFPYNPFSFRTRRAARIIERSNEAFQCGKRFDDATRACKHTCAAFGAGANADQAKALQETCISQCQRSAERELNACNTRRFASEWRAMNDSWIPAASVSASADFYPYGTAASPPAPATPAHLEWWGGMTFQASFTFRKVERWQTDLWGSFRPQWRSSGAAGSAMARYAGGGASVSYLAWSFLDRDHLERHPDYAKTGVLPGAALGASLQGSWCLTDDSRCADGRTRQVSLTPYLDVRITSQLQVRLGVPISWYHSVAKDGAEAAPTLSIASTVAPP